MLISQYYRIINPGIQVFTTVCLFFFFIHGSKAQDVLFETLDGGIMPSGWTIEQQNANWSISATQHAGSLPPELKFSGIPAFFGYTRLVSPLLDVSGAALVRLEFKYSLTHLIPGYTIGVAVRNSNGNWNTLWSKVAVASIPSTDQAVLVNYPGFNAAPLQFCFFFEGNSQNLSNLYFDDIRLYMPPQHDVAVKTIANPSVYLPNATLFPKVVVSNNGQQNEGPLPVYCKIYDGNNNLVYNSQVMLGQLAVAAVDTVLFPSYVLALTNDFYRIEAGVSLASDLVNSNDTISRVISTLSMVDRKFVLTEMATATWCAQCPATTDAVRNLILAGKQLAVAGYHSSYGDPFTNAASVARLNYYNVAGYPTTFFDGVLSYAGNGNAQAEYQNLYNQRIVQSTPFDIKIYGSHTGNDYSLKIILYRMAPVYHQNLVLRVLLTESAIPFNWLGQTQINHTVRLMIPDTNGIPVDLVNHVQLNIPLSFTMNTAWVPENCEVIAFLQDTITKEVLQVFKRNYDELVPYGFTKVQGYVRYRNADNTPLSGVTVKLRLGGGVVAATTTNALGYYSFTGIAPGSYYLSCSSTANWGGVNAADALWVMKYFTGLSLLDPLQLKAADSDVSNTVNSTDALNLMRRFVAITNKFSQADWVFESPVVNIPNSTIVNQNIKGLCTGDVDGSYLPQ